MGGEPRLRAVQHRGSDCGLLCVTDLSGIAGESAFSVHLRDIVDSWNASIEHYTYVRNTPIARM